MNKKSGRALRRLDAVALALLIYGALAIDDASAQGISGPGNSGAATTTDRLIVKYRSTSLPKASATTSLQPEQTRRASPTARSTKISAAVPYCEFVSSNLTITVTDALGRMGSATTNTRFSNPRVPGLQCP